MSMGSGYALLARGVTTVTAGTGEQAAPTSGELKTLWSSADNVNSTYGGSKWKRLLVNIYTSNASAANGLKFEESNDNITWHTLVEYTIPALTYVKNLVASDAPYVRVRYQNPVIVLTEWRMSIYGDHDERGTV